MKLDILSLKEAKEYVPKEKSYAIRIFGALQPTPVSNLVESDNWVGIEKSFFDDMWPKDWKEFNWVDKNDPYFNGFLPMGWENLQKQYPKMTKERFMELKESIGHPEGRYILFDKDIAKKILDDFEKVKDNVEAVMVHCSHGKNRSPAIGIAMNEIYNWGIEGLKEKFPEYRRYIYDVMKRV